MTEKKRYVLLDGLRGIAALMVLFFHCFEGIAYGTGDMDQGIYHGFLAVDFFFLLSGFVIGHAYDDRWGSMTVGQFFKRRLIRLQPMVIAGVLIGMAVFCFQGRMSWSGDQSSWLKTALMFILALLVLPCPAFLEDRGYKEIFPLNGPHWSLFIEYIGNILYALLLCRLPKKALKIWVALSAAALIVIGIILPEKSTINLGWSSEFLQLLTGFFRMSFSYGAGLLMNRMFREKQPAQLEGTKLFILCSALLVAMLVVPNLHKCNIFYELVCILLLFPQLIWFAARGNANGNAQKTMNFLQDISYPIYAIHYPFIYLFIGWLSRGELPFGLTIVTTPIVICVVVIGSAILLQKYYEKPVRRWLSSRSKK